MPTDEEIQHSKPLTCSNKFQIHRDLTCATVLAVLYDWPLARPFYPQRISWYNTKPGLVTPYSNTDSEPQPGFTAILYLLSMSIKSILVQSVEISADNTKFHRHFCCLYYQHCIISITQYISKFKVYFGFQFSCNTT